MTTAVTSARPRRTGRPPGPRYAGRWLRSPTRTRRPGLGWGGGSPPSSIATRECGSRRSSPCPSPGWSGSTSARCSSCSSRRSGRPTRSRRRSCTPSRSTTSAPSGARRLPERRLAHDPDGGDRHRRRRGARLSDRVLHGARRLAADARDPDRRGRDAAVGQLPREGLRLADDARARGRVELGARPARAGRPRAHRNRALARLHLPLAAVHDPARLRRARADPAIRSSRRRRTSAHGRCARSSASSCRSRSRRSSPARSSRSR